MEETALDPLLASKERVGSMRWRPGERRPIAASPAQPRLPSVPLGGCREDPGNAAPGGAQPGPAGESAQGGQAHGWYINEGAF